MNKIVRRIKYIGIKMTIQYFIIQKILRINSHVPWPVHPSSLVIHPENIENKYWRPYLGYMPGCYIQALNGIQIGKNVRVGPGVKIISANHDINNFDAHIKCDPIIIENNCWIGANAIILPEVHLEEHVIVGAGAVVTKNFPKNCVIAGNPAKIIKEIEDYSGKKEW